MLLFVRMALGSWGLRRILRDSKPVPTLGPGIFESALLAVPGSVGCFRARILLPQAWSGWDPLKLRAVLAHERSHVRRGDWLIRVVSRVNVCIFWFHPLSWWMEHELARLAEDACDDAAVAGMDDREDYVATLVDIAQVAAADGAVLNWRVISMARDSNVIRRVNRILQARAPLPKPFGRLAWVTLLACSLPVIYLSAAVKLASAVAASPVAAAPQRVFPVRKSSARLIAQASPNQPLRPTPPPAALRPDEASITLCILIDSSGSMWGKRPAVEAAALALVAALKPRDKVCILYFDDEVLSALAHGEDFTSDVTEMKEALTHIEARGGKAMRDAVRMSIDRMEQASPGSRKVLVLITEGYDSSSTVSQEQLLTRVRSSGVPVYCIGLVNGDGLVRAGAARLALRQLAEASGGRVYYPDDLAEVESISPAIAAAVRK
jgi:Mg-chelatase subunit ChlD